jgi:hypothetical protein
MNLLTATPPALALKSGAYGIHATIKREMASNGIMYDMR